MVDARPFGAWLRQRRKALDLTQDSLAERVSCSPAAIQMIEQGQRRPSRQLAELLADHLHIAPEARDGFLQAARTGAASLSPQPQEAASDGSMETALAPFTLDLPDYLTPLWTSLVGREGEIEAIEARLLNDSAPGGGGHGGARMLTLTGPAGVGKTQLAAAIASNLQSRFRDGACFVALAPVRDPAMVIPAIAGVLGVREQREESERSNDALIDALKKRLWGKELLLVLDNVEQVLEAGPAIASMLGGCPGVKALVTSREPLHVRGESVFPVPPLRLPDLENLPSAEALSDYSAVVLFVERAQKVVPNFALTGGNAREVATICARLDGLPLAIELVVARIKVFSPKALLAKLEGARGNEAFRLYGEGARDLPERHRTLQAAIGWSYDLLSMEEQNLFARLSVFMGGCTLPGIEAVCNAAGDLGLDPFYGMSSLLDKNLLKREQDESEEEPRFHLLETIREYAVTQLEARGVEEATRVRQWHAEYYLALVEAAEPGIVGEEQQFWLDTLAHEHNNIQVALSWLLTHGDVELAARMAAAMGNFWYRHTHPDATRWLSLVLKQKQYISPIVLNKILQSASELEVGLGNLAQAQLLAEENLEVARSLGDTQTIIRALLQLGRVITEAGDVAQAELSYRECLRLARDMGDILAEAQARNCLAEIARFLGDYGKARELYESNLRLAQEAGSKWDIAVVLHNLGKVALGVGDPAKAIAQLWESLQIFNKIGSKSGIAYCLAGLGEAAIQVGALERGVTLFGASDALLNLFGIVLERVERTGRDDALNQARQRLDPSSFKALWEAGQNLSLEQAIDYVSTL